MNTKFLRSFLIFEIKNSNLTQNVPEKGICYFQCLWHQDLDSIPRFSSGHPVKLKAMKPMPVYDVHFSSKRQGTHCLLYQNYFSSFNS